MAKLYIANCTKQIQDFWYRVPGCDGSGKAYGPRMQKILEGSQVMISGDLQQEEIDFIVADNARYGLINVDEVDRAKPFVGLCYSIGKPVAVPKIEKLFVHNQEILEQRAEDNLKATALANNQLLEKRLEVSARDAGRKMPNVGEFEMSLSEESKNPSKTEFYREGGKKASGIRINRSNEGGPRRKGRAA